MAHKIKLDKKEIKDESRIDVCNKIRDQLLLMEKYGTKNENNKMTYVIIPYNHPHLVFPFNLEDRVVYIIDRIQKITKLKLDPKIKKEKKNIELSDFNGVKYILTFKDNNQMHLAKSIIDKYHGKKDDLNWIFVIE